LQKDIYMEICMPQPLTYDFDQCWGHPINLVHSIPHFHICRIYVPSRVTYARNLALRLSLAIGYTGLSPPSSESL